MEYIIIEARTVKRISKRIRENYMLLPPADTWDTYVANPFNPVLIINKGTQSIYIGAKSPTK